jgi:CheY-like chemotaxis protein
VTLILSQLIPSSAYTMTDDVPSNLIVAVADDDISVRESLGSLLESSGYSVHLFDSAGALLASGVLADIDCLISDIDMPRIDGYELARLASMARPELPVILITGHHDWVSRSSRGRSREVKIFSGSRSKSKNCLQLSGSAWNGNSRKRTAVAPASEVRRVGRSSPKPRLSQCPWPPHRLLICARSPAGPDLRERLRALVIRPTWL